MRRSGLLSLLAMLPLLLSGCGVHYGFSKGGLPRHIRSVAVEPFENETSSADLPRELFQQVRREMRGTFGLREAPATKADALVRGVIRQYDVDVPVAFSADRRQATARRRLQIIVDMEIVDQSTGKAIWQQKGLRAEGEYPEGGESQGRQTAVNNLVRSIIEGAQSQW